MAREIPWTTVDELVALLKLERDALDAQIAALESSRDVDEPTARLAFLLARYVVEGSAKRAVATAKDLGWRIASTNKGKPSSREWTEKDIYDAIAHPPPDLPEGLVQVVRRVYGIGQKATLRAWG